MFDNCLTAYRNGSCTSWKSCNCLDATWHAKLCLWRRKGECVACERCCIRTLLFDAYSEAAIRVYMIVLRGNYVVQDHRNNDFPANRHIRQRIFRSDDISKNRHVYCVFPFPASTIDQGKDYTGIPSPLIGPNQICRHTKTVKKSPKSPKNKSQKHGRVVCPNQWQTPNRES